MNGPVLGIMSARRYELQAKPQAFVLFKTLFEEANGKGSFAAMLASVPEPTNGAIMVAGLGVAGFVRIQRCLTKP